MHQDTNSIVLFLPLFPANRAEFQTPVVRSMALTCCLVNNLLHELQTTSQMLWGSEKVRVTLTHLLKMWCIEL